MEKFIKKILLYLLIPFMYIGINAILNYKIIESLNPKVEAAKILILGDSHFTRAINPAFFDSAINVSIAGEPYVASYWKLKKMLPLVQPDTVFLAFSPYNISSFNDFIFSEPVWANMLFETYYPIQELEKLTNIEVNYKVYYRVLLRQYGFYPHKNHIHYIGKYKDNDDGKNRVNNFQSVIDRHFYKKNYREIELDVSKTAVNYLDSMINLCQSRQITPVLVGTPLHPNYFERIPNTIKKNFEKEKKRLQAKDIKIIDDMQAFYPDSCYLDADHLNSIGSEIFTKALINKL